MNPHGTIKTQGTPLHVLWNTSVPLNPCWRTLAYIVYRQKLVFQFVRFSPYAKIGSPCRSTTS